MQIFTELFASLHTSFALVLDHWEEGGGRGKLHLALFRSGKKTFESTNIWSITALCWLFKAWRTLCRFILGGRLACHILRCTCLPKAKRVLRDMFNERRKGLKRNLKKQANHPQNIFCVPSVCASLKLCLLLNYFWRLFLFNFHQKSVRGIFCHFSGLSNVFASRWKWLVVFLLFSVGFLVLCLDLIFIPFLDGGEVIN